MGRTTDLTASAVYPKHLITMTAERQQFKRHRAETIAACATKIAEFCKTDPMKLFTDVQSRTPEGREAMSILVYHLHHCGMSFNRIGKLVSRSPEFCKRANRDASIRIMDDTRELLASLPFVPNTLEIACVEYPAK